MFAAASPPTQRSKTFENMQYHVIIILQCPAYPAHPHTGNAWLLLVGTHRFDLASPAGGLPPSRSLQPACVCACMRVWMCVCECVVWRGSARMRMRMRMRALRTYAYAHTHARTCLHIHAYAHVRTRRTCPMVSELVFWRLDVHEAVKCRGHRVRGSAGASVCLFVCLFVFSEKTGMVYWLVSLFV